MPWQVLPWQDLLGLGCGAALPLLETAAGGAPGNPVYLYRLGMAQAAVGQKDKARNSLQTALKQGARFDGAAEARAKLQELTRG